MRLFTTTILLLTPVALASLVPADTNPNPSNSIFSIQATSPPNESVLAIHTTPTAQQTHSPTITPSPSAPDPSSPSPPPHLNNLELRQGVGAAGGPLGAPPSATQMSPITTYLIRGPDGNQTPVPYTQVFSKVPDQWPAPTQGTIGLGTIQGVIGVVKTNSKREAVAEPTQWVGGAAGLVRRNNANERRAVNQAGMGIGVNRWMAGVVVAVGLGAVAL